MNWRAARYTLPLGTPPKIERITVGTHNPGEARWSTGTHVPGHWMVHLYSYRATITIDGQCFPIRPGFAGLIPPTDDVAYRFVSRSMHQYAHFSLREGAGTPVAIPVMQDLGQRFHPIADRFHEAIRIFTKCPERAEARLLDILWDLAMPSEPPREPSPLDDAHPAVRAACDLIEQHLWLKLTAPLLGEHVELSPDRLTRLFQRHLGTTVVAYIRKRRVLRARHLLLHSSLPLKTIAQQVGIPDPHFFNKTIRRELGLAPREVRERAIRQ